MMAPFPRKINTRRRGFATGRFAPLLALALALAPAAGKAGQDGRWWPVQKAPRGVVKTDFVLFKPLKSANGKQLSPGLGPEHMMAESVAGLAAQAVNEGRLDEMVWIGLGSHKDYARWYKGMVRRLGLEERGTLKPWELVARYAKLGIIKGYILYAYDYSPGGPTRLREGRDESVNVATALAGLLGGILISEEQEPAARAAGLERLFDARGKTVAWCFQTHRDRLNRSFVLAQDPQMPHNRDIAIAQRMLVVWGTDEPTPSVYAWLHPLSSVLGWNAGDEGKCVVQISRNGHILLPSNWAVNLAILSAGTHAAPPAARLKPFDPTSLTEKDAAEHAVAFMMSDGDNVQWMMGNFCSHPSYWASPAHGKLPFGWGVAAGCLGQVCPEALAWLAATQRDATTIVQAGGGYFYPDLLGADRPPGVRQQILARHARRIARHMRRAGTRTLTFLCMDLDSPQAREAYAIFAREIDGLAGMLAVQYAPYEAGDGRIHWAKDGRGTEVPVVTCKFSIWANLRNARAGTPARVAALINQAAATAQAAGEPLQCWAITHAWSAFRKIEGNDPQAENAPHGARDAVRGVVPTLWCAERLRRDIRVVCPEELLWRIRLRHHPETTRAAIARLRRDKPLPSQRRAP